MFRLGLWLRWSARDLRSRWLVVVALALVIALGVGTFAGLGSTATWRRESNDRSYAATAWHDVRVELQDGTFAPEGELAAVAAAAPSAELIVAAEERLIVPTQVEVTGGDGPLLVQGRLTGAPAGGEPPVDSVHAFEGRALDRGDAGASTAMLEQKFVDRNELELPLTVSVSSGAELEVVGVGVGPEDFFLSVPGGGFQSEADFAVVYTSLATAQAASGLEEEVNDLVLRLAEPARADQVAAELREALADPAVGVAATVTTGEEDPGRRVLYDDIEGDQQLWNVIAALVLAGAALATFNLTSRIVEAQRRQLGAGMALGIPPAMLGLRPVLVGAQVALLGSLLGIGVGWLLTQAMKGLLEDVLPLPVLVTRFQTATFVQGMAIGVLVPVVATIYPVWRAVRVPPIEALRSGALSTKVVAMAGVIRTIRLPGGSLAQLPLRSVLRNPRRTLLTSIGVGAAIAVLVAILGLLDSFFATVDAGEDALLAGRPDRTTVTLDRVYPSDAEEVAEVASAEGIAESELALRLGAQAFPVGAGGSEEGVELLLEVLDFGEGVWAPEVSDGVAEPAGLAGVVLAAKAAEDLGVGPGDTVTLRHPARSGAGLTIVDDEVAVVGLHSSPIRTLAYADRSSAAALGVAGLVNSMEILPEAGVSFEELKAELFALPTVAGVESAASTSEQFRDLVGQFTGVLRVIEGFVLLLAFLIAFNSASLSTDERSRETATLFAFGVRLPRVLGLLVAEALVVGVAGTAIGLVLGRVMLRWLTSSVLSETLPDIGILERLSAGSLTAAVVLGIVAVALAPLLVGRRLARLDIPASLRLVE